MIMLGSLPARSFSLHDAHPKSDSMAVFPELLLLAPGRKRVEQHFVFGVRLQAVFRLSALASLPTKRRLGLTMRLVGESTASFVALPHPRSASGFSLGTALAA